MPKRGAKPSSTFSTTILLAVAALELFVTVVLGLPGRPMHEVLLVRPGRAAGARSESQSPGRLALVLYGLGDDLPHVSAVLSRRQPFAAAIPAGQPWSAAAFHAARAQKHETV